MNTSRLTKLKDLAHSDPLYALKLKHLEDTIANFSVSEEDKPLCYESILRMETLENKQKIDIKNTNKFDEKLQKLIEMVEYFKGIDQIIDNI